MQKRFLPVIAAATILLLAAVIWIVFPPGTEASTSDVTAGQPVFFPVAGAGTVIILRAEDHLEIMSVFPYKGYSYEILDASGSRVQVLFRGDGREVLFTAVLDGHEVRVNSSVLDDDGDILAVGTTSPRSTVTLRASEPIAQLHVPTTTSRAATTTAGSPTTRTTSTSPAATTAPPRTTSTAAPTTTAAPATTAAPTTTGAPTTTAAPTTTTTAAPTTTTAPDDDHNRGSIDPRRRCDLLARPGRFRDPDIFQPTDRRGDSQPATGVEGC